MKLKLALITIVLLALSLFAYYTLRVKQLEKKHVDAMVRSSAAVVTQFSDLKKSTGDSEKALKAFLDGMQKKSRTIAVIALADTKMTTRIAGRNRTLLPSQAIYDAILEDFARERIVIGRELPYVTRYYSSEEGPRKSRKFYLFLNAVDDIRILTAYPGLADTPLRTRMALEASLILVLAVLFWAGTSLALDRGPSRSARTDKKTKSAPAGPEKDATYPDDAQSAFQAEESIPLSLEEVENTLVARDRKPSREMERGAAEGFKDYVVDLFRQLTSLYAPQSVALYVSHSREYLSKAYELKGESFLSIDSPNFETIDMNGDIGGELKQGSSMLLEGGRRALIPLVYRDSFLGAVEIRGNGPFTGSDLPRVRAISDTILKDLNDYLVVNDIMVDRESGLPSKTCLMMKYHEMAKRAQVTHFGVIVLSLFPGMGGLDPSLRSRLLRTMAPAVNDILGDRGESFRLDDYLAALLPGHEVSGTGEIARRLTESLGRYRIKLSETEAVTLEPLAGWAHSRESIVGANLIEAAQRSMNREKKV